MLTAIDRVKAAILELQNGRMIILTDHPDRENEGDLVMAAERIVTEQMNFMIRHGGGIVCLPLTSQRARELDLPLMVPAGANTSTYETPFTVSVDARDGISTGVSAADRTLTSHLVANAKTQPSDLVKPGHLFPLQAKDGGVLERQGHTEGATDLVRLAGFSPVAVLSEIMNPDGTMTRGPDLIAFANEHQLFALSIDDIIEYRLAHENMIAAEATATIPLDQYGNFSITVIKEKINGNEHTVLSNLSDSTNKPVLVRIHSSCTTGDLFGSNRCDCHRQFHYAMNKISEEGGLMIYLNQEGRGIGLFNKIKAYALQEQGFDTVEANMQLGLPVDERKYYIAANILRNHNINHIRLLTNNPQKISDLHKYGISHIERAVMPSFQHEHNQHYLATKQLKLNHAISFENILELQRKSQ